MKLEMLLELFEEAAEAGAVEILDREKDILTALLTDSRVRRSQFFEVIAYGRTVHAEMDAITTAARLGRSIQDGILYTTTFPCHECARHIVASGIRSAIYVEPYPKSRVKQLHADSIQLCDDHAEAKQDGRVLFRPFIGFSAHSFGRLFSPVTRKMDEAEDMSTYGHAAKWSISPNTPVRTSIVGAPGARLLTLNAILAAERVAIKSAQAVMERSGSEGGQRAGEEPAGNEPSGSTSSPGGP